MDESKLIFFTGAPGSKWSAVSWVLTEAIGADTSDRTPERLMVHAEVFNGVRHTGVYFGPGMELGEDFDCVHQLSREAILEEIQRGWTDWNDQQYHIVRCHQFINNMDWLIENFPDSKFVVVTRSPDACVNGWLGVGGIDIPYPDYTQYYVDNANAERLIRAEARLAHRVIFDHQMDTYIASRGHFARKFGLTFDDENATLASYIRSLEGYMYTSNDPYHRLKHDVLIGYHGW